MYLPSSTGRTGGGLPDRPEINFSKVVVGGDIGGLVFAVGCVVAVLGGFPTFIPLFVASLVLGVLLAAGLIGWRRTHTPRATFLRAATVQKRHESPPRSGTFRAKCHWTRRTGCPEHAPSTAITCKPLQKPGSGLSSYRCLRLACVRFGPPLLLPSPSMGRAASVYSTRRTGPHVRDEVYCAHGQRARRPSPGHD
jgi:hypothetical protein